MVITASQIAVFLVATVVIALSAWGMVSPGKLVVMVTRAMDRDWGIYVAVIVRLVLGAALIIVASVSRFPTIFSLLGWIALIAAAALVLMGRVRLRRLIRWFDRLSASAIRVWLLFGIAFGGFLVYGIFGAGQ